MNGSAPAAGSRSERYAEGSAELGIHAAEAALANAKRPKEEIDAVVFATLEDVAAAGKPEGKDCGSDVSGARSIRNERTT